MTYPIAKQAKKKILVEDIPKDNSYKGKNIEPLPYINDDEQRYSCYISGISGSGKSFEAARQIKELRKMKKYKDNIPVLITLSKDDDKAYKGIKYHRLNLDDMDFNVEFYRDTIMIFDDWESGNKKTVSAIHDLIKKCLERGRKLNIAVLVITHMTTNYNLTRDIIFECENYVLYSSNINSVLKFAKSYLDMDKKDLQQLKGDIGEHRSIYIRKSVPRVLITPLLIRYY